MSACKCEPKPKLKWRVTWFRLTSTADEHGHHSPSRYSEIICPACWGRWRTKARYVDYVQHWGGGQNDTLS